MKPGETRAFGICLGMADGTKLNYANAAAFLTAGWSLAWYDLTGASITAPSYTLAVVTAVDGLHWLTITTPTTGYQAHIVPPSTSHVASPAVVGDDEVLAYNTSDIAAMLMATSGIPLSPARNDPAEFAPKSWVNGDSLHWSISIPATTISDMGWSDLSGLTLSGAMRVEGDNGSGSPAYDFASPATITATGLIFTIQVNSFPSALALSTADYIAGRKVYNVDFQAKGGGMTKTIAKGQIVIIRDIDRT